MHAPVISFRIGCWRADTPTTSSKRPSRPTQPRRSTPASSCAGPTRTCSVRATAMRTATRWLSVTAGEAPGEEQVRPGLRRIRPEDKVRKPRRQEQLGAVERGLRDGRVCAVRPHELHGVASCNAASPSKRLKSQTKPDSRAQINTEATPGTARTQPGEYSALTTATAEENHVQKPLPKPEHHGPADLPSPAPRRPGHHQPELHHFRFRHQQQRVRRQRIHHQQDLACARP